MTVSTRRSRSARAHQRARCVAVLGAPGHTASRAPDDGLRITAARSGSRTNGFAAREVAAASFDRTELHPKPPRAA
jgi:hypothetical protein